MKQTKNKNVRQKYLVGSTVKSIIEDPSTALAQNNIDIANAQYKAASNPWVLGLEALGQLTTQGSQFFEEGGTVQKSNSTFVKVKDKRKSIPLTYKSKSSSGEIKQLTKQQVEDMKEEERRYKFGSDLYAKDRIDKTKKAISGITAVASYIPNPIGITTAGINFGIDAIDAVTDPNFYNNLNATSGGIKATGTSNILRRFGKYGRAADDVLDMIGNFDSGKDVYESLKPDKKYATGGQINSKVPVEVEGGEAGELPNGQLLDFNGPSHGQGGIPIDLPEGTEIYSKRIKIEGESMADRKLKRESVLARYTKKAKKTGDAISSNTLKRVQRSVDIEDEEDKKVQQLLHDILNGTLQAGSNTTREKHAVGGLITKYPNQEDESLQLSNTLLPDYLKIPLTSFDTPGLDMNGISSDITSKVNNSVKQSLLTPQKDVSGDKFNLPITGGDALNIAGNVFQGVAPYLNTLQNRATDTPNVNSFKNYGEEGIDKMAQAENYLKQTFDSRLKEIGLQRSDSIKRGRNSSGSVNLMRALDTNADMAGNDAENKAYDDYATQMINILGKEAQLENDQDRMVMQGEYQRDIADRQDKDAFSTAKGQGLRDIGMTVANAGKQVNDMKSRDTQFNLLDGMYENMDVNQMTGEISGRIAKALNIPEGSVLKPNEIQDAISNGKFKSLGLDIKTVQDYYKKFGLTDPNPANNVISLGRTTGTTTKQGGK